MGRTPGKSNLCPGAAPDGALLNKLYRKDVSDDAIVAALTRLIERYARSAPQTRFGDFVIHKGCIAPNHSTPRLPRQSFGGLTV